MVSHERGNLPGSHYYFYSPTEVAEKFYYYMVWCGHYYCQLGYDINRDYYPPLLLVHVRKGTMLLDYGGKHYAVKESESFLIDCQEPHHYRSTDGLEFVYFHFDGVNSHEFSRHLIRQNKSPVFTGERSKKVGKIIYSFTLKMLNGYDLPEVVHSEEIHKCLCALASKDELSDSDNGPVQVAIQYIKMNLDRQLTLEEIAECANLSPYYFSRVFKAETGYPPVKYVSKLRMNFAMTLLKTTSLSVEEIACRVGYSNSAGFINAFAQNIGLSPNKFRKMPI